MARAILFGTPVAPGIAIGKTVLTHLAGVVEERFIMPENADAEVARLLKAAEEVQADLGTARDALPKEMSEHREIIQTHMMICRDPRLLKEAEERIRTQRLCAPWALSKTTEALCAAFRDLDDPYLRERAQDIRAVALRIQCRLAGKEYVPRGGGAPSVHVAEDLSPADTLELHVERILALVMAEGGPTSHTAILARSLRIPAVVGVTGILETAREGELVIVDALRGRIYLDPDEQELAAFAVKQEEYIAWERDVRRSARLPAETLDGVRIEVQANMENVTELECVDACGAEGVGLYRTEYAYLRSRQLPDEEQLYEEYATAARKLAPRRVVFRSLDVGGDKMLHSQLALKEPNPALGLRAIRFCLRHQNLFRTQLRAILRAGVHGNVALMLPMISGLAEVQFVRRILSEARQELTAAGIPYAEHLPVGVMIEVPSAIFLADALARECDFLSIGTNDLIHYLLAIDRTNKHVNYLHEPLHPAVMRSLQLVIDCAHREGIGVSVCGELAADPYCLAVLIGMGVDAVSATPQSVPAIKHFIRRCEAAQCMNIARAVLMTTDVEAANRLVTEALSLSLHDDLAFHTTMIHPYG